MNPRSSLPSLRSTFFGLVAIALLTASSAAEDRIVKINDRLNLPIPQEVRSLHIPTPHAKVLVEVDENGEVIDSMPIEASHFILVEKAVSAVLKADIDPAIVDGEPARSRAAITVNFYDVEQVAWRSGSGLVPQGGSVSDAFESRLYKVAPENFIYTESKPNELDEPLKIVDAKLRIYTSEEGVQQKGRCVVEYYVGPEGTVHFPRILSSDHDDLSMSALLTLETTRFEPPLRRGNPTCVKVRQPFNFN